MFKSAAVFLSLWAFGLPAFVQEKAPDLPDYTKLEVEDWHLSKIIYNGKPAYLLDEHFEPSLGFIGLYYKPISEDEYLSLKKMDGDYIQKNIRTLAGKEPLVIIYYLDEYDSNIYIYEKSRKWYEFYRLWHSEWRLAGQFINAGASEDLQDAERIDKFIEERFGLKFFVEE